MSGKVVHVSDELHARFKKLAEERGVPMSQLLAQLIEEGTTKVRRIVPGKPPKRRDGAIPVQKKGRLPSETKTDEEVSAYERPAFWEKRP